MRCRPKILCGRRYAVVPEIRSGFIIGGLRPTAFCYGAVDVGMAGWFGLLVKRGLSGSGAVAAGVRAIFRDGGVIGLGSGSVICIGPSLPFKNFLLFLVGVVLHAHAAIVLVVVLGVSTPAAFAWSSPLMVVGRSGM